MSEATQLAETRQKYKLQSHDGSQISPPHLVRRPNSSQRAHYRDIARIPEPVHGLRIMIKEEASPLREQPAFPAELARRGMLAPETRNCKRALISLKADVPMLGTVIEQNGDGFLEESYMPAGWPFHINGAVGQRCIHQDTTLHELDALLGEYDMKRGLVEIAQRVPQRAHRVMRFFAGQRLDILICLCFQFCDLIFSLVFSFFSLVSVLFFLQFDLQTSTEGEKNEKKTAKEKLILKKRKKLIKKKGKTKKLIIIKKNGGKRLKNDKNPAFFATFRFFLIDFQKTSEKRPEKRPLNPSLQARDHKPWFVHGSARICHTWEAHMTRPFFQPKSSPISRPMKPRRSQSHIPNCASCCSKSSTADTQWKIPDMCVRGCSLASM